MTQSKNLENVRRMPFKNHWPDRENQEFNIHKSEVIEWLMKDEGIMKWVFGQMAKRRLILFNKEKGGWEGRDVTTVANPKPEVWLFGKNRKGRPRETDSDKLMGCPGLESGITTAQFLTFAMGAGFSRSTFFRRTREMTNDERIERRNGKWRVIVPPPSPTAG